MNMLVLGLVVFLGIHSTRIVAEGWRTSMVSRLGDMPWKGLYSLVSIAGFVLIVWGYGEARQHPVVLWASLPAAVRHVASLLTLIAFVLIAAAYIPGNRIKAKLHHPMILGVKAWAFAHLIANNTAADLVLFGSFLLWAALDYRAARRRDRVAGAMYPAGTTARTLMTIAAGGAAWVAFAFWLHARLIGISPL